MTIRRVTRALILCGSLGFGHTANAQALSDGDWTGAYGGVHFGGIHGEFDNSVPALPGPTGDSTSTIGGVQLGYNHQNGSYVFGGEIDLSLMELFGDSPGGRFEENLMGSLRLRAGKLHNETLFYGTLGVAWTEMEMSLTGVGTSSDTEAGIILGGGAEWWLRDNLSARAEALYVDAPKTTQNVGGTATSGGSENVILRAGLSLHF